MEKGRKDYNGLLAFWQQIGLEMQRMEQMLGEEGGRMKWAKEELRDAFHALAQHYLEPI